MSAELICDAIKKRLIISFRYKGTLRTAEPHLLGYDSKSHLALSAWQLSGGSGQSWRLFHLSEMSLLSVTSDGFVEARPGYNPNDEKMARIVCRL